MIFARTLPAACLALLASASALASTAVTYSPSHIKPPAPLREFRGAWIASVGNIDWPSRRELTTDQQKAELIAIFEMARRLNLNSLLLQVRPASDALYQSSLEPWSEYLTGTMGKAPRPFYDPLKFAVDEAHKRGVELHAWFNPFRAGHITRSPFAANTHISKARPQLVRTYGRELWLDPGDRAVHEHVQAVILDVVRRYDVDGIVMDDYFYPYPVSGRDQTTTPFPDDSMWKRYQEQGGRSSRDDWRRENVNVFVRELYSKVKVEKPWVKVGIAPFGIWRPKHPPSVDGLDAYDALYADSRRWLAEGWADYFAPQLYWTIASPEQSFPVLLQWWCEQNRRHRHIWPAGSANRVGPARPAAEIVNQVRVTRKQHGATGNVHWSIKALMRNTLGVTDALRGEVYQQPSLVPPSPWLDSTRPALPKVEIVRTGQGLKLSWEASGPEVIGRWVLQTKSGSNWTTEVLPGPQTTKAVVGLPDAVAVSAVDRSGNVSPAAVFERRGQ